MKIRFFFNQYKAALVLLVFFSLLSCKQAYKDVAGFFSPLKTEIDRLDLSLNLSQSLETLRRQKKEISQNRLTELTLNLKANPNSATIQQFYPARPYPPFFVEDFSLNPRGKDLRALLKTVEAHGLLKEKYPLAAIKKGLKALKSIQTETDQLIKTLPPAYYSTVKAVFAAKSFFMVPVSDHFQIGEKPDPFQLEALIPKLQTVFKKQRGLFQKGDRLQTRLDATLLDSLLIYIQDMALPKESFYLQGVMPAAELKKRLNARLLEEATLALKDLKKRTASYYPANDIYKGLQKGYLHFLKLAAKEKDQTPIIPEAVKLPLKPGFEGEVISGVKKRLQLLGYYNGPINSTFDEPLKAALIQFQTQHGLDLDGNIGTFTKNALNQSIERRRQTIRLGLMRWRVSHIDFNAPFYIRVNVPQFEVEFYEKNQIVRTSKIVVGNNLPDINKEERKHGKLNRTRLFQAKVEYITLNPYWNVPERIVQNELLKFEEKTKGYLKKNDFIIEEKNGKKLYRQRPGYRNALGKAVIWFPNENNIFMHDTPEKWVFTLADRSFSHGCIRLLNAVDIAKWLIAKFNQVPEQTLTLILLTSKEAPFALKNPIPLYIEYNTVSVDSAGNLRFFNDLYGYDQKYFKEGKFYLAVQDEEIFRYYAPAPKYKSDTPDKPGKPPVKTDKK